MIASCGEAVLDRLADGSGHVGGSPFNVAVGIARLGAGGAFLGALPVGDGAGPFLVALEHAGCSCSLVQRVPQPVLEAEVRDLDGRTSYRFTPEDSADRHLSLPRALAGVTALHVGSLSLARLPAAEVVEELCDGFDGFISLDPNARPSEIADLDGWRARVRRIAGLATLVKMSTEDAAVLAPGQLPGDLAAELLNAGCSAVLVTDGEAGARLSLGTGEASVAALPAGGGDTVGAGDSFTAGLLVALQDEGLLAADALATRHPSELDAVLGFATAAASLTCRRAGPYGPTRAEVEELLAAR